MARSPSNFAPRLRRMLLMVPWLLETGGSTVTELAQRFGVSEDDVIRDLNLVMCCGVPPYGAEHMITVMLDDDGSVLAWKGPFFTRPMRLTPTEGFAVLAAGRTLLAVPGADPAGPLATALDKLEDALGSAATATTEASGGGDRVGGPSLDVDLEAPPLLAVVRAAADARERLRVVHYSAWRDPTERTIDPLLVFSSDGRWYVTANDSRSGERRHFRIDRFASAEVTGERFERPPDAPTAPPDQLFSGADATEVTLVLPASARWVAEAYPPLDVEDLDDGRLRVRLAIGSERWLERLLLRVGPEAVVEAPAALVGVGAAAARRLLERYGG
jgi:proteasome accessory factor C